MTGLTLVSGTAALISGTGFGPDEISIAIAPYAAPEFSTLQTWEFAFTTGAPGAEVPLPAALPLSLAGLAALGLIARRRG